MTTKPELPVKHGVNVKLKCPKRTVNMGGDTGVCVDGVVLASSGSPVCVSGKSFLALFKGGRFKLERSYI